MLWPFVGEELRLGSPHEVLLVVRAKAKQGNARPGTHVATVSPTILHDGSRGSAVSSHQALRMNSWPSQAHPLRFWRGAGSPLRSLFLSHPDTQPTPPLYSSYPPIMQRGGRYRGRARRGGQARSSGGSSATAHRLKGLFADGIWQCNCTPRLPPYIPW